MKQHGCGILDTRKLNLTFNLELKSVHENKYKLYTLYFYIDASSVLVITNTFICEILFIFFSNFETVVLFCYLKSMMSILKCHWDIYINAIVYSLIITEATILTPKQNLHCTLSIKAYPQTSPCPYVLLTSKL